MAVSMEDVRRALDPEEPDYPALASLGEEALPHLRELARQSDPMLASKAVYAASLLGGDAGAGVVVDGARSSDDVVQVAAAAAVRNLSAAAANDVLGNLRTSDPGIAKVALASAPEGADPGVIARLRDARDTGAQVSPDTAGGLSAETGAQVVPETELRSPGSQMPAERDDSPTPAESSGLMPGEKPDKRIPGATDIPD